MISFFLEFILTYRMIKNVQTIAFSHQIRQQNQSLIKMLEENRLEMRRNYPTTTKYYNNIASTAKIFNKFNIMLTLS